MTRSWPERWRWFLAEFWSWSPASSRAHVSGLVSVAQNAEHERGYLEQVVAELHGPKLRWKRRLLSPRIWSRARSERMPRSYAESPPLDLACMVQVRSRRSRPTLGTLRAVTSTGTCASSRTIPRARRLSGFRTRTVLRRSVAALGDHHCRHGKLPRRLRAQLGLAELERGRQRAVVDSLSTGSAVADALGFEGASAGMRTPRFVRGLTEELDNPATYTAARMYMIGNMAHLNNMRRLLVDVRAARNKINHSIPCRFAMKHLCL